LKKQLSFLLATALATLHCCRVPTVPPFFEAVGGATTGITFANTLPPDDSALNIVNYLSYYNGGGVAAGDIDGDGLLDLYFTSNLDANRLYRNLGDFRFEDITARAGDGKTDLVVAGNFSGVTPREGR